MSAIAKSTPGAYALSRHDDDGSGSFIVSYAGRSDSDLKARLLSHVSNGKYTRFKCGHASTPKAAFEWECNIFHDFGGTQQLDNQIHPDRPHGSDWVCPRCYIFG